MNREPGGHRIRPQVSEEPLPPAAERFTRQPTAAECTAVHRAWDLRPGDVFHGRTIVSVRGEVGLGSSPVAVLSLTGENPAHPVQTRVGAAHPDTDYGCDAVWLAARAWVRTHGLREGDAVDLDELRSEVMSASRCLGIDSCPRATSPTAAPAHLSSAEQGSPEGHPAPE